MKLKIFQFSKKAPKVEKQDEAKAEDAKTTEGADDAAEEEESGEAEEGEEETSDADGGGADGGGDAGEEPEDSSGEDGEGGDDTEAETSMQHMVAALGAVNQTLEAMGSRIENLEGRLDKVGGKQKQKISKAAKKEAAGIVAKAGLDPEDVPDSADAKGAPATEKDFRSQYAEMKKTSPAQAGAFYRKYRHTVGK